MPQSNQIQISAAIMNSPFFENEPDVINYGALGMVIGHEVGHAFETTGSRYDAKGKLRNWWDEQSKKEFDQRTQCLVGAYNQLELKGRKADGTITLDENIADDFGLQAAFDAFKSISNGSNSDVTIGGRKFTQEQLFFLGTGQMWCSNSPDELTDDLMKDKHSPDQVRTRGMMRNNHEFQRVFQCKPGSKMNPKEKCEVWSMKG
jgi:endothelin-converting enzyme